MSVTRLEAALAAIDDANADDPNTIVFGGARRPKELTHAELATGWVHALDVDADESQLLAARAHHLRRWELPRSDYPEGRSGYLRWRAEQKRRHARAVETILGRVGYDAAVIERVQQLIRKQGLGSDPAAQTHEDALCLVFLQTQLDELIEKLGADKALEVLRKTVRKMSPGAVSHAEGLDLSKSGRAALQAVLR